MLHTESAVKESDIPADGVPAIQSSSLRLFAEMSRLPMASSGHSATDKSGATHQRYRGRRPKGIRVSVTFRSVTGVDAGEVEHPAAERLSDGAPLTEAAASRSIPPHPSLSQSSSRSASLQTSAFYLMVKTSAASSDGPQEDVDDAGGAQPSLVAPQLSFVNTQTASMAFNRTEASMTTWNAPDAV